MIAKRFFYLIVSEAIISKKKTTVRTLISRLKNGLNRAVDRYSVSEEEGPAEFSLSRFRPKGVSKCP